MSDEAIHDKVDAFADGELPAAEAEEFRAHLAGCDRCQSELRDIMMLAAATAPLAQPAAAPATAAATSERARRSPGGARSVRRRLLVGALSALAAAAAIVLAWRVWRPEPIVLAQADARPLEPRLSYAGADRWRPYGVERGGGAREPVPVATLAALERRGDWRGLADAYLLAGEPGRADEALTRAGDSADVESDRAATALQAHDPEAALAHAARALASAPEHAQAAWNRALALRDLGLVRTAATAFDELARRGERGWSDEARTRAEALRAAEDNRERTRRAADAAGRGLVERGVEPPAEVTRAWPALIAHYRALSAHDAKADPFTALSDEARAAAAALAQGDAATAKQRAGAALSRARSAGAAPADLPRRLLEVLAGAARAQSQAALADAYAAEARSLASADK